MGRFPSLTFETAMGRKSPGVHTDCNITLLLSEPLSGYSYCLLCPALVTSYFLSYSLFSSYQFTFAALHGDITRQGTNAGCCFTTITLEKNKRSVLWRCEGFEFNKRTFKIPKVHFHMHQNWFDSLNVMKFALKWGYSQKYMKWVNL